MFMQILRELDQDIRKTEISAFSTEYLQQEIDKRKKAENSAASRKTQMKITIDELLKNGSYTIDDSSTKKAAYIHFNHEGMSGHALIQLVKGEFFSAP